MGKFLTRSEEFRAYMISEPSLTDGIAPARRQSAEQVCQRLGISAL